MSAAGDKVAEWRWSAYCDELVIEVAEQRGVNPLLTELMRQDVARYRRWADETEEWAKRAMAAGHWWAVTPELAARVAEPEPCSSRFARLLTAFKALC